MNNAIVHDDQAAIIFGPGDEDLELLLPKRDDGELVPLADQTAIILATIACSPDFRDLFEEAVRRFQANIDGAAGE